MPDIKDTPEVKEIVSADPANVTTTVTPISDKVDYSASIEEIKKQIADLTTLMTKKEVAPVLPSTEGNKPVVDDFEVKMAAYEKKKFEASLTADDKAKIAAIPGSGSMSIETLQYVLGLAKASTVVPNKNFPAISGGASNTVTPQSEDDYLKSYKAYEESLKKGGKK